MRMFQCDSVFEFMGKTFTQVSFNPPNCGVVDRLCKRTQNMYRYVLVQVKGIKDINS